MLDRVNTDRGGADSVRAQIEAANGVVCALGLDTAFLDAVREKESVTRLFVVTTDPHAKSAGKVEIVERNPFRVQRRDLGHTQIDYLYADLWSAPWDRTRTDDMRALCREVRPVRAGYRWQELDIAAEWVAAGCDLTAINVDAVDMFRLGTGIMVEPRTAEYAKHCGVITSQNMGRR